MLRASGVGSFKEPHHRQGPGAGLRSKDEPTHFRMGGGGEADAVVRKPLGTSLGTPPDFWGSRRSDISQGNFIYINPRRWPQSWLEEHCSRGFTVSPFFFFSFLRVLFI